MEQELNYNNEEIKVLRVIGDHIKSRTQSIKVVLIEKDGKKFVSLQKWWRKSGDESWREGKGFHFDQEDTQLIQEDLTTAIELD